MRTAIASLAGLLWISGCHGHAHDESGHSHGDHAHGREGEGHDEAHGTHGEGHGHGHGEGVAIGITRWTDTLELFAEHPPAVVGQEVPFLAHVTILDGFLALDDAQVRLSLAGPAELSGEATMLRSGIYRPVFRPSVPGTYEGTLTIIAGGQGEIGGFEIEVYANQAAANAAHPGDEDDDGAIGFLKEQQWKVPFATAFARREPVCPTVEVSGELTTPPGGVAPVHAAVGGRIMAAAQFPAPRVSVRAGELLATIAPTPGAPEDAARASLAVVEAQARLEASRVEVERAQRMVADQAIPQRRLDEARRQLQVAEAGVDAAKSAQSMYAAARSGRGRGSWRITAPIAGVVDAVEVSPGEAVATNELLFRIVDPSVLWVRAEVPEAWASRYVPTADAAFQVVGDEEWHAIELAGDARLVHASRSVDERRRTVRVVYALGEADQSLRVGGAVRVLVPVGEAVEAVTVPRSAILDVEGRDVVYVQEEGEAFSERAVRLGPSDGDRVAVLTGIDEGERVVTRGAHLVRLAGSSGAAGHGHVH